MIYLYLAILWVGLVGLILATWPRHIDSIHEEEWENDK